MSSSNSESLYMQKARWTTALTKQYKAALNSPSQEVFQQINKVPKLLLISYYTGELRGLIHSLYANRTLVIDSEDEDFSLDIIESIGERLENVLGEELFHAEIEWRSVGRATARLLDKESEYDAYIQLNGDFCPIEWLRLEHDNVFLLAYHIQYNESHEYVDK